MRVGDVVEIRHPAAPGYVAIVTRAWPQRHSIELHIILRPNRNYDTDFWLSDEDIVWDDREVRFITHAEGVDDDETTVQEG